MAYRRDYEPDDSEFDETVDDIPRIWHIALFSNPPKTRNFYHWMRNGHPMVDCINEPLTLTQAMKETQKRVESGEFLLGDNPSTIYGSVDPATNTIDGFEAYRTVKAQRRAYFIVLFDERSEYFDYFGERRRTVPIPERPDVLTALGELPSWVQDNVFVKNSGCWIWTGAISRQGYGTTSRGNGTRKAHRAVYQQSTGTILDSDVLLRHTCDERMCVSPSHLIPGRSQDNYDDIVERDRMNDKKWGEPVYIWDEMNLTDVRNIRLRWHRDNVSWRKLSKEFGVPHRIIKAIINYRLID